MKKIMCALLFGLVFMSFAFAAGTCPDTCAGGCDDQGKCKNVAENEVATDCGDITDKAKSSEGIQLNDESSETNSGKEN